MTTTARHAGPRRPIALPVRAPSRSRWLLAGWLVVVLYLVVAPLLPEPDALSPAGRLQPPSWAHLLGTDHLGRDLLARLLHGAPVTAGLAAAATVVDLAVGATVGVAAGVGGGRLERLLLALIDGLIAIPRVLLALVVTAVLRPGVPALLLAMALTGWLQHARVVHGMTRRLVRSDYVQAATALGADRGRIIRHHLLPNMRAPVIAVTTTDFAHALLTIAGLSFLGLGVQPPTPDWGLMIADGLPFLERAVLPTLVPAAAVLGLGLAVTLLGQSLTGTSTSRQG